MIAPTYYPGPLRTVKPNGPTQRSIGIERDQTQLARRRRMTDTDFKIAWSFVFFLASGTFSGKSSGRIRTRCRESKAGSFHSRRWWRSSTFSIIRTRQLQHECQPSQLRNALAEFAGFLRPARVSVCFSLRLLVSLGKRADIQLGLGPPKKRWNYWKLSRRMSAPIRWRTTSGASQFCD